MRPTVAPLMVAITLSEAVIYAALIAAGVKFVADQRGWTRSPALVRQENADLRERNATLQAEVTRLDALDREKAQQIAALEARVEELQKRDQKAVLDAMSAHDERVKVMWDRIVELLTLHETNAAHRAKDANGRHDEAMGVWREIRDATNGGG